MAEGHEDVDNVVKSGQVAESKASRPSRSRESSDILSVIDNPFELLLDQEKIVNTRKVKPVSVLKEIDHVHTPFAVLGEAYCSIEKRLNLMYSFSQNFRKLKKLLDFKCLDKSGYCT
jgi:hypothetical protein